MKFSLPFRLAQIFLGILVASGSAAELSWEVRERQISTTAGTDHVVVKFPFVNSNSAPVSITAVDTGCVCTTAKASKSVYARGERGELAVEFTLGDRVGRQERLLNVTTSGPDTQPQQLRLVVDIAELITVRPRLIFWAVGDPSAEKSTTITLTRPAQTKLPSPLCSSPAFTARIEPTARPEIFLLHITPVKTAAPANGTVRLEAIIEGKKHVVTIFAAIR